MAYLPLKKYKLVPFYKLVPAAETKNRDLHITDIVEGASKN